MPDGICDFCGNRCYPPRSRLCSKCAANYESLRAPEDKPMKENREGLRMPFGMHKGELVEDIPIDYLVWCLENLDRMSDELRKEMENQVELKRGRGVNRG